MSVLNFPRIYLNGHMFWNPPTANNNDVFPLYDAVKMDMNWPFLKYYDVTPQNAPTALMPWSIRPLAYNQVPDYVLQVPTNANPKTYPFMPAEWDLFGDNACGTVTHKDTRSVVVGGELQANNYILQDALVSKNYQLQGNPFGGNAPSAARFVDISPWQNTFTALYFDKLVLGDAQCGLTLNRQYRMLDRFLNFNWGAFGGLSTVTTTWQTCFPKENLQWVIGNSVLLKNLQQQMTQQGAKGLMFRFSTYLTFYDKNGVFNDFPPINTHSHAPADMEKVRVMYEKGLNNVADIFFNPAYSRTAGTLGLWFADEFPTAPGGRRLMPASEVPVYKKTPGDTQPSSTQLGVISAQINPGVLSLDLSNGFPFYPVDPSAPIAKAERFNAGNYTVGVQLNGKYQPLAQFGFEQYNQAAFDKRSGLLDLPINSGQQSALENGSLLLQQQGATPVVAAAQRKWTAEVIESGSFIDVGDHKTLQIMVQQDGVPAPAGTVLWVAEYGNAYMITTSNYYLAFSNPANFTLFYDNPDDRNANEPWLPQFTDAPPIANQLATGSGRRLTALHKTDARNDAAVPPGIPISYQQYLSKPTAINLRPCLAFDEPFARSGTLRDTPGGGLINYSITKIRTDARGIAQLGMRAVAPGFPTLRFFLQEGASAPQVPFSFDYTGGYADFLAPLRVLPMEPQLQQNFINYWNSIYKSENASQLLWNNFIYAQILQPFYYLYPIMNKFMPLNSQTRVEGAIDQLIVLISKPYQEESTLSMPITRDMSQSRRAILELWAQALVKRNYPPIPLSMSDFNTLN